MRVDPRLADPEFLRLVLYARQQQRTHQIENLHKVTHFRGVVRVPWDRAEEDVNDWLDAHPPKCSCGDGADCPEVRYAVAHEMAPSIEAWMERYGPMLSRTPEQNEAARERWFARSRYRRGAGDDA
jgi:hypothetical protein